MRLVGDRNSKNLRSIENLFLVLKNKQNIFSKLFEILIKFFFQRYNIGFHIQRFPNNNILSILLELMRPKLHFNQINEFFGMKPREKS